MKTIEESFRDWESYVFGFGYGSGEPVVLGLLKHFFHIMAHDDPRHPSYDYQVLESALGAGQTWLMINALCHACIIDYGTSPRHGWFTFEGQRLCDFVRGHSADSLVSMCESDESTDSCEPHCCNCGPNGYEEGKHCDNPFWR